MILNPGQRYDREIHYPGFIWLSYGEWVPHLFLTFIIEQKYDEEIENSHC